MDWLCLCGHALAGRKSRRSTALRLACAYGMGRPAALRRDALHSLQRLQPHCPTRRSGGLCHENCAGLRHTLLCRLLRKDRTAACCQRPLLRGNHCETAHLEQLGHPLLHTSPRARHHPLRRECHMAAGSIAAEHLRTEAEPPPRADGTAAGSLPCRTSRGRKRLLFHQLPPGNRAGRRGTHLSQAGRRIASPAPCPRLHAADHARRVPRHRLRPLAGQAPPAKHLTQDRQAPDTSPSSASSGKVEALSLSANTCAA